MTSTFRHHASTVSGHRALVIGVGLAGASAARALLAAGNDVALTARAHAPVVDELTGAGAAWLGELTDVPPDVDLVVASPGVRPTEAVLRDAAARGVPVWGEIELAWQLRGEHAAPWLALTGTNGKTTTVRMLESMLRAAGLRAAAVGNVGTSIIDAVVAGIADRDGRADVLAVELSSQQLHFAPSIKPAAAALLNLAPDHLDWHGSWDAYVAAKAAIWTHAGVAVGNLDDPVVASLLAAQPAGVGFTLGVPAAGQLGVVGGRLVSRAFDDVAELSGVDLLGADEVRPAGTHNVANALAAAALARSFGVAPTAIAAGLRAFAPDPHRNQPVLTRDGVTWVDDSKATNPHAAAASLAAYPRIVWVAGGQLKGVDVDELVRDVAGRLVGAVLLGQDRAQLAASLARHAPEIPVITVDTTDDGAMTEVVAAAAGLARPGDVVLLAPAGASYDMFANYGARGDAFAAAAAALPRNGTA
jgi:UDP-N-acetylmuramoylalanine--D-glutamate ligase